ncbi:hypothetical protein CB621_20920 [Salmonella enterica subsp. enterica serovar Chester]|nr:hypothetical protein [Salmonella enterica subsp. enterica serovar Chester]
MIYNDLYEIPPKTAAHHDAGPRRACLSLQKFPTGLLEKVTRLKNFERPRHSLLQKPTRLTFLSTSVGAISPGRPAYLKNLSGCRCDVPRLLEKVTRLKPGGPATSLTSKSYPAETKLVCRPVIIIAG